MPKLSSHALPSRSIGVLQFRSVAYQAVLRRLERFARDDTVPILLQGESGTGKTTLARLIHARSLRAQGPFQHVVLSTLDDSLASSELFGHVAGAFTDARHPRAGHFASASGGTLFLDEIGKASKSLQGKLLHAMEYGEIRPVGSDRDLHVNARIIAATNVDLSELISKDAFLPDLHARLATFRVTVPPLRERRADIPLLAAESVRRHATACGYSNEPPRIDDSLMAALQRAAWPNNVRQLDAAIHRLMLEADGDPTLTLGHCVDELAFLTPGTDLSGFSRQRIEKAIVKAGSLSEAARALGVDRKTLRRRRLRATE